MARGHIGNAGFALPEYRQQQLQPVGGGGGLDMLFKLAGLEQQQGSTDFNQQLELAKLQELLASGASERGLKGSAEERAQRLQEESILESKAARDLSERKFAYEQSQAGEKAKGETEKNAMDLAGKMIAAGNSAGALRVLGAYSSPAAELMRKEAQTDAETKGRVFQRQLKGIYEKKDPKALQATMDTLEAMPDVVKAIDWNKLKWGGDKAAAGGQGFADSGILGMLWNTPGALQNVGKGIANVGLKAAAGSDAPQVPYTEFTNPNVLRQRALATGPQGGNVVSEAPLAAPLAQLLKSIESPTGPVVSQPPIDVLGAERRFPKISALPPNAFPSVEDLIARSSYGTPPQPPEETGVSADDLARLVAPPIDASQAATGGEEQALNENLSRLVAPNLSAIQESQYAPPASFPRQMQPPAFEPVAGGPSAFPGRYLQPETERYPFRYNRPPSDFLSVLGL